MYQCIYMYAVYGESTMGDEEIQEAAGMYMYVYMYVYIHEYLCINIYMYAVYGESDVHHGR
jgi:hypothetical protein